MTGANDGGSFAESMEAAAGPLRRMAAITAQVALSTIPADASCQCLCSIYEPHACGGWRAGAFVRKIHGGILFGKELPSVTVPLCRGCFGAELRKG